MPRLSLWRPVKGNDYRFTDRIVGEQFMVGGVDIFVHKYLEVIDQGDQDDASIPNKASSDSWDVLTIQDMLFVENRNRLYDKNTFVMRGHFNEADKDFDLLQFGLAIADGSKYITFPLNEMIDMIGRKLMAGDVLELTHVRDDALLDKEAKAINLWMVVQDASYPTEGYSPLWFPHLWRVKAKPLPDAPEYFDITRDDENQANDLIDLLSTHDRDLELGDSVVDAAEDAVPERNTETRHFYVIPGDEFSDQHPWVFAGDGIPPNNSVRADAGTSYPTTPMIGDYFIRTDYEPSQLFQYVSRDPQSNTILTGTTAYPDILLKTDLNNVAAGDTLDINIDNNGVSIGTIQTVTITSSVTGEDPILDLGLTTMGLQGTTLTMFSSTAGDKLTGTTNFANAITTAVTGLEVGDQMRVHIWDAGASTSVNDTATMEIAIIGDTGGILADPVIGLAGTTLIFDDGVNVLSSAITANPGTGGYSVDDTLTILGGTFVTAATIDIDDIVPVDAQDESNYSPIGLVIAGQDETNYDGAPATEGAFIGGTGYQVLDVLTMDDGSTITVDVIDDLDLDTFGPVEEFTVTTGGISISTAGIANRQTGSTGTGLGFVLAPEIDNITVAGNGTFAGGTTYAISDVITLNDGTKITVNNIIGSAVSEFTVDTSASSAQVADNVTLTQASVDPMGGSGFTLTLDINNQAVSTTSVNNSGSYIIDPINPVATSGATSGSNDATFTANISDTTDITVTFTDTAGGNTSHADILTDINTAVSTALGIVATIDANTRLQLTKATSGTNNTNDINIKSGTGRGLLGYLIGTDTVEIAPFGSGLDIIAFPATMSLEQASRSFIDDFLNIGTNLTVNTVGTVSFNLEFETAINGRAIFIENITERPIYDFGFTSTRTNVDLANVRTILGTLTDITITGDPITLTKNTTTNSGTIKIDTGNALLPLGFVAGTYRVSLQEVVDVFNADPFINTTASIITTSGSNFIRITNIDGFTIQMSGAAATKLGLSTALVSLPQGPARWTFIEVDYRKTYNKANRILETHINNDATFTEEGETIKERQPISKAIKPRSDFE